MLGTLFGWGFGMAAMRSANAVRTDATKAAGLAYVKKLMESSPKYAADPFLAEETAIFRGQFLDVRYEPSSFHPSHDFDLVCPGPQPSTDVSWVWRPSSWLS